MSENQLKVEGILSKGFGILSKMVMQDRELHYIAKVIYSYFCSFAGSGETCFPTRNKICYDLQISIDTFSKYLKQLVEVGYINVEQIKENGRFSHNIYTILSTKSPCPKRTDTEDTVYGQTDTNNNNNKNNNNIKQSKKEKTKKKPNVEIKKSYNDLINGYTDNEKLKESLVEFVKMRSIGKIKLTNHALELIFVELDKFTNNVNEKIDIVNQSIMRGWSGVFPLSNRNFNKDKKFNKDLDSEPSYDIEEYEKYNPFDTYNYIKSCIVEDNQKDKSNSV